MGRTIGDGNFAVVRECTEHSTGREYALKIINKGKCRGKVCEAVGLTSVHGGGPLSTSTQEVQVGLWPECWICPADAPRPICLFPGAHDTERGVDPPTSQTPQHRPAD